MYHAYKFVYLISVLIIPALLEGGDKRDGCLSQVSVQCPSFWLIVAQARKNGDLSRLAVLASMSDVLKSCPVFGCVDKFVTSRDKCIAKFFLADSRNHGLTPDTPIEDYTRLAGNMFRDASDQCSSLRSELGIKDESP